MAECCFSKKKLGDFAVFKMFAIHVFCQEEGDEPKVLQMAKKIFSSSIFSNIAVMFFCKVFNF